MIDATAKQMLDEDLRGARAFVPDPFPPSSRQAPYSAPYSSSRAAAETLEYSQPAPSVRSEEMERADHEDERTEWCVDFGTVLATMDTFELWAAIDRGDITPAVRVWREGMECWTPIEELPELAIALTTASSRTPDPITLQMEPRAQGVPAPPPVAELPDPGPATLPAIEEVRAPQNTLISGPQTSNWTRISHRILPPPTRRLAGAQFWAALGSAVAATAITVAVVGAMPSRARAGRDAGEVRSEVAVAPATAAGAAAATAVGATAAATAATEGVAPAGGEASAAGVDVGAGKRGEDEPGAGEDERGAGEERRGGEVRPRHDDRGQHRLRRSGRVSSGR